MRRPLALLCVTAALGGGLAAASPSAAAPSPAAPASRPSSAPAVEGEVLVGYVAGAEPAARDRARGRASARLAERLVKGSGSRAEVERVQLPAGKAREQAIAELKADPAVAYAEPNYVLTHQATATDPYVTDGRLWGMYGDASTPANAVRQPGRRGLGARQHRQQAASTSASSTRASSSPSRPRRQRLDEPVRPGRRHRQRRQRLRRRRARLGLRQRRQQRLRRRQPRLADDHGTHVAGTIGAVGRQRAGVAGVTWTSR